jgi:Ankyrin repeats (3 copies)
MTNHLESNKVFDLLQEELWEKALKEAQRNPALVRDLFLVDGFYDGKITSRVNALHMAGALGAPAEVIQGLAAVYPPAATELDRKYGRNPLHIAVMSGSPAHTISALLIVDQKASRQKDHNGRIPLHYACKDQKNSETSTRLLIRAYPEGAMVADDSGFLALHVACRYGQSLNVIRMLIRASPESLHMQTKKGSTPLACAQGNKCGMRDEISGILERFLDEVNERAAEKPRREQT